MKISRYEAAGLKCIEVAPDDAEGRDLPLVVMMHGRGDWGESYVDIAPAISQKDYRFVFPTAPLPLQGAMFEWFRFDQFVKLSGPHDGIGWSGAWTASWILSSK